MYAVFLSGGKQYKVRKNQIVRLEKLKNSVNTVVEFNKILMISNKDCTEIGAPFLPGKKIQANIEHHGRSKKIRIIKFNRRKHYKKQQGHRQCFTDIKIIKIDEI